MSSRSITIGGREIGAGRPCFVIAEAGINHNGDVKIAAELVEAAAAAGADAIKFQTHLPEHEMLKGGATAAYVGESLFDLLARTALSPEGHVAMRDLAKRKGIIFMSTPFSREAADYLEGIGVPAFKTGSGELTNIPLQRHIARKGKPMIVSTGMSTPEEIDATVKALQEERASFALMHCTSTYPTPFEHVQLGCIGALQAKYGVPVGFSDHTLGTAISLAAVASGANIFEKHFTASRALPGPDQQGSMEPKELETLVKDIRAIEQSLGATKKIQPGEQDVRNMALHSVVSIRDVAAGATITAADVWVKRPGTGIPARQLNEIIGRVATRAIAKDALINQDGLRLTVLGVITARGGSKGLPGKNLRPLAGTPLIAHTIDTARESNAFDRVILSTDDDAIAAAGRARGCDVPFMRPAELARDETPHLPVLQHAVAWLREHEGYTPDAVMILQPTSPLRRAEDIRGSIALLERSGADSVVSVSEVPAHYNPMRTLRVDASGMASLLVTGEPVRRRINRRQDMPDAWTMNGAIYLFRTRVLDEAEPSLYGNRTAAYVMPPEFGISIDSLDDWNDVEHALRLRSGHAL